jgi:hypothetical protein
MRAVLSFNMDDADDAINHYRCVKSLDMALFIWDWRNKLNQLVDTSEDGKHIDEAHLWEAWNELKEAHDINIDRIII